MVEFVLLVLLLLLLLPVVSECFLLSDLEREPERDLERDHDLDLERELEWTECGDLERDFDLL